MIDLRLGDCLEVMQSIPSKSVDLTVTSPPYDNLRNYNGYSFDFKGIAQQLWRITKDGGVVVWIVGDATINGSETGTSFKQALYFKEIGFNLHDTMIYQKGSFAPTFPGTKRYQNCFEYMFILSKETPKTFNGIMRDKSPNSVYERKTRSSFRQKDGSFIYNENIDTSKKQTIELNVWKIDCGYMKSTKDKEAYKHSAIFPEKLAFNHIQTWSNENDVVLDCFLGSGTTGKIAKQLNRQFIGIEVSQEYMEIAKNRIYA
jgi:site-specific DNA-methyltransferase (adenine-specific)